LRDTSTSLRRPAKCSTVRYDDLKRGRVKPIDGEEFFETPRRREDQLLRKHSPDLTAGPGF
jgi:hypothetical protein